MRKLSMWTKTLQGTFSRRQARHAALASSRRPLRVESLERRELLASVGLTMDAELGDFGFGEAAAAEVEPLDSLARLHSKVGAPASIFLDFDGHFQQLWGAYSAIQTPVFDLDGDATTYSPTELATIEEIWSRVSEDFAPFNVDVTTQEPTELAPGAPDSQPNGRALRVAIGGWSSDWYKPGRGGVAYLNSFTNSIANVAYVFPRNLANLPGPIADAASHETGHAFGLHHQSKYDSNGNLIQKYHRGEGDWSPTMGAGNREVTTWHNGRNEPGQLQDDMAILAGANNGFGYRSDDHGNTAGNASAMEAVGIQWSATGVVEKNADVDVFRFVASQTSGYDVEVNVASWGPNLDAALELRDSAYSLIATADPVDAFAAKLDASLTASAEYFVVVRTNGVYGRVGQYSLSVAPNEDVVPPTGFVVINDGAAYTNSRLVTLKIDASDEFSGVAEMRFAVNKSDDASFSDWAPFAPETTLLLPNYQGVNYVNLHLRDSAGNIRRWIYSSIVLDTAAPTGTVIVNGGAEFTNSRNVVLDLSGVDGGSGVAEMRFSINKFDDASFGDWQPFSAQSVLTLPNYQGTNYVNVQLRDRAGNVRRWIYDSIILDSVAPTGSIVINGGDTVTNTREISIDLSVFDAVSGVTDMRLSINKTDDASFGDWQPFTPQTTLTLPDYPGANYVNVHFRDAAGNIRRWVWDSITLEATEESPPA